ncbi:MAG: hypothetical protein GC201_01165 [Alphaproteobacteria bacterium]|nr:hypothetical protein [Alphaproteobacteria bacterium]
MFGKWIAGLAALSAIGGCAGQAAQERYAAQVEIANRPIICDGQEQCEIMWSRAIQWVKNNCAYRFQTVSDDLIQTAGPNPYSIEPAFVVNKLALGGGKYQIEFDGGCDNMFGCSPTILEAKSKFVMYLMGAHPNDAIAQ